MDEIVPFDYDSNRQNIVERFTLKGYDASYEGSNAAVLSDILSYIVSVLNVNTAANVSELLLSKATQRKNILYTAREQGYEAQSKVSYQYRLTLIAKKDDTLPDNDTTERVYELPKYFSITNGANTYYYFGETITKMLSNSSITDVNDTSKYFTVIMKEGTLYLQSEYPDVLTMNTPTTLDQYGEIIADNKISVPFTNVEDNGIEMTLDYIDEDGIEHANEPWYRSTQFLSDKDTNLAKKFIRLDNIELGTPQLYFSIAGVGNTLRLNTLIKLNILSSKGGAGYKTGEWNITDTGINTNFVLYTGTDLDLVELLTVTGADEESATNIQVNAPLFHNSANRAVTKYDYISICNRFSNVEYTQCWGGDEDIPMKLGYIYLSMVPGYRPNTFLNDELKYNFNLISKDDINLLFMRYDELYSQTYDQNGNLINPGVFDVLQDYKIMTTQLVNIYPFYLDFDFEVSIIRYSLNNTKQVTHQNIFNIIESFFNGSINDFEESYFHSNLIKRIDAELTDLSGLNCSLSPKICLYGRNTVDNTNKNLYEYFTDKRTEMGITFYLGMPFENIYELNGDIKPGVLPDISTADFITVGDSFVVDFASLVMNPGATTAQDSEYYMFDIKYNNVVCGRYYVDNGARRYIKIDLYVNEDGSIPADSRFVLTPLTNIMFNTVKKLNLNYATSNFRLYKHMFPRLSSLKFL